MSFTPSVPVIPRRPGGERTGTDKLRIVQEAATLDEAALGALLRREGLQRADLTAWRQAAEPALEPAPPKPKAGPSAEAKRVQELERELVRKDRALAETAALLVLKKSPGDLGGRGRRHPAEERALMIRLIDEAVEAGARRAPACRVVGLSGRTVERWRAGVAADRRQGPPPRLPTPARRTSGPRCWPR